MKDILSQLVSMRSVTDDLVTNEVVLQWCRDWLAAHGVSSVLETHNGRPILWWGAPLGEARFLFNTHVDVVPGPDASFSPRMEGDRMWGRGCADTKSSVTIFLEVSRRKKAVLEKKNICFSLVTDEELGGASTK